MAVRMLAKFILFSLFLSCFTGCTTSFDWLSATSPDHFEVENMPGSFSNKADLNLSFKMGAHVEGYRYLFSTSSECPSDESLYSELITAPTLHLDMRSYEAQEVHLCLMAVLKNSQTNTKQISKTWTQDTIPPTAPGGLTYAAFKASATVTPTATWTSSSDTGGTGVSHYEIQIGTSAGRDDVISWTPVGDILSHAFIGSFLPYLDQNLYMSIRAVDKAGNPSNSTLGAAWYVGNPYLSVSLTTPSAGQWLNLANQHSLRVRGTCGAGYPTLIQLGDLQISYPCSLGVLDYYLDTSAVADSTDLQLRVSQSDGPTLRQEKRSLKKDTQAPVVSFTGPADNSSYTGATQNNFLLQGTCSDHGRNVLLQFDFGLSSTIECAHGVWSHKVDLSSIEDMSIQAAITMTDAANNTGETKFLNLSNGTSSIVSETAFYTGRSSALSIYPYGENGQVLINMRFTTDDIAEAVLANIDGSNIRLIGRSDFLSITSSHVVHPMYGIPEHGKVLFAASKYSNSHWLIFASDLQKGTQEALLPSSPTNKLVNVSYYRVTPDKSKVIFLANYDDESKIELYSIGIDGQNLTKLNPPLVDGGNITAFVLSSDSNRVAFWGDILVNGQEEIYLNQTAGGTPVRLRTTTAANSNATFFKVFFSPNDSKLTYQCTCDYYYASTNSYVSDIYLYDIGSGVETNVSYPSRTLNVASSIPTILPNFSPDSRYLYYALRHKSASGTSLWRYDSDAAFNVASLDTPDPLDNPWKILQVNSTTRTVQSFAVTPDGKSALVSTDIAVDERYDLYLINLEDGATTNLTESTGYSIKLLTTAVNTQNIKTSRDSTKVFFPLGNAATSGASTSSTLYSVDLTAPYEIRKLDTGSSPNPASTVLDFFLSQDESKVVYFIDENINEVTELYSLKTDGSGGKKRLSPETTNEFADVLNVTNSDFTYQYFYDSDLDRVYFMMDDIRNSQFHVYSVKSDGSSLSDLTRNQPPVNKSDVGTLLGSSDYRYAIWSLDNITNITDFFSFDMNDNTVRKLTSWSGETIALKSWISANNTHLIIACACDDVNTTELYSVPLDGSGSVIKISGTFVPGGNVNTTHTYMAGDKVVFMADKDIDEVQEAYVTSIYGGAVTKINSPLSGALDISTISVSPDGNYVALKGDLYLDNVFESISQSISGAIDTDQAKKLHPNLSSQKDVSGIPLISPDSRYVAFLTNQIFDSRAELYVQALNPSASGEAATLASDTLPTNGLTVSNFQFTPDSTKIVYLSDQNQKGVPQLFVNTLSGVDPVVAGTPTLLTTSSSMILGVASDFIVTDNYVIARMDQDTPGQYQLYRVNLDGSGVQKLSPNPVPQGQVASIENEDSVIMSPDGSSLVFTGDLSVNNQFDLYFVKTDGSEFRKLTTLQPWANVNAPKFVTNTKVIYQADNQVTGVRDWYSINIDATGGKRISPKASGGRTSGTIQTVQSADGSKLLYKGMYKTRGRYEVFLENNL